MHTRTSAVLVAIVLLILAPLGGCTDPAGGDPGADLRQGGGGADGGGGDAGAGCQSSAECGAGMICQGPEGCGVAWRCTPNPGCKKDLVQYCGCDGTTFQGSSDCPGRPFRSRGACARCMAQDARGVGPCDAVLGVFWNGKECRAISGCSCEGADCGRGFRTLLECQQAYASCPMLRAEPGPR